MFNTKRIANVEAQVKTVFEEIRNNKVEFDFLKKLVGTKKESGDDFWGRSFQRMFMGGFKSNNPTLVERIEAIEKYLDITYREETIEKKGYVKAKGKKK